MPTPKWENDKELFQPLTLCAGVFLMTVIQQQTGTQMAMGRASVRRRRIGRPAGLR